MTLLRGTLTEDWSSTHAKDPYGEVLKDELIYGGLVKRLPSMALCLFAGGTHSRSSLTLRIHFETVIFLKLLFIFFTPTAPIHFHRIEGDILL